MASLHRVLPAPIEDSLRDRIQGMSQDIFRMMDCKGCVRIDYMYDRAEVKSCTSMRSIPFRAAWLSICGKMPALTYRALIDRMVDLAEKAHEDKNEANYAYHQRHPSQRRSRRQREQRAQREQRGGSGVT